MSGSLGEPTVRVIDRLLVEHARHLAALQEHAIAHDEMNTIQNRRIDRLVERLDRAYTKIHNLEREVRTLKERM
jgi:hypothetical protein